MNVIRTKVAKIHEVNIGQPYAVGHVLTDVEASTLNQTWTENVRNNIAPTVRKLVDPTPEEIQEIVSAYEKTYAFGSSTRRSGPADPVGKETLRLIRNHVTTMLSTKGLTKKGIGTEKFNTVVTAVLTHDDHGPKFRAIAVENVNRASEVSADILDSLLADPVPA